MAENSSATKKKKTVAHLMSELAALLENDEKKKEKTRSNRPVFFQRYPTTGQRVYFSKRQQQCKSRRAVPSQPQDQVTTSAENVDNDIDIGVWVIITSKTINCKTSIVIPIHTLSG